MGRLDNTDIETGSVQKHQHYYTGLRGLVTTFCYLPILWDYLEYIEIWASYIDT